MEVSESEAIQQVQNGDVNAFAFLVHSYEARITRYLKKFLYQTEDIEDILQDVFLKAYMHIQSFDRTHSFSPWLYRIAHNEAINFLKKNKIKTVSLFDVDTLFPHPIAAEQSDIESERELIKKSIDTVLTDIDIKYREILLLYFYEDLSYKEIAQTLQMPVATVGVRIQRGKKQVEDILRKKGLYTEL
ncbi:MAG: hypothetical protein RI996_58 [Candidatus Parcubacteria bacterium]|jgi:RNA polymerase sigma-70 factor (ECF subfamily)